MRSTIATLFLGLSLVAGCEVGDVGGGGGGGGDDVQGGADAAVTETPRLSVMVDKATVSTELASANMVTVSMTGSGGFSGAITLSGTVVDTAGVAIPGWTVGFNTATVNLTSNGTGSAVATVMIPSDSAALTGQVKITVTSSVGMQTATSDVTALKQVTINVTEQGGQCVYPTTASMMNMQVKAGTKVRFVNKFAADNVAIHSQAKVQGGISAFGHEINTGHLPDTAYEVTVNQGASTWYCHAPGPTVNNLSVTVVP